MHTFVVKLSHTAPGYSPKGHQHTVVASDLQQAIVVANEHHHAKHGDYFHAHEVLSVERGIKVDAVEAPS